MRALAVRGYNRCRIKIEESVQFVFLLFSAHSTSNRVADTGSQFSDWTFVSDRPCYAMNEEVLVDPYGYKGTDTVIVGKNGCLFINAYINEYFGLTQQYRLCTDEQLLERVKVLREMQDILLRRNKAMVVVITPSKVSFMKDYVPDWYLKQYSIQSAYIRPYYRFKKFLKDQGVNFLDSQDIFREAGLQNVFPKTSIHWNKLASFEVFKKIIAEYERQSGQTIPHVLANDVLVSKAPPGFGNDEMDIYDLAYSAVDKTGSIVDELYYSPDVFLEVTPDAVRPNVLLQGGSFRDDFVYYFTKYEVGSVFCNYNYNYIDKSDDLRAEFEKADFIVLEINEQFVHNMGGLIPSFAQDHLVRENNHNIIDLMYNSLINWH